MLEATQRPNLPNSYAASAVRRPRLLVGEAIRLDLAEAALRPNLREAIPRPQSSMEKVAGPDSKEATLRPDLLEATRRPSLSAEAGQRPQSLEKPTDSLEATWLRLLREATEH